MVFRLLYTNQKQELSIMNNNFANHKKQSIAITSLLFLLLFLTLYLLKISTQNSLIKLEGGGGGKIAINFGDSDVGQGKNTASTEKVVVKAAKTPKTVTSEEQIITSNSEDDAPTIIENKKQKIQPKKELEKPVVIEKPKISKSTNDALSNILNTNSKSGDGDDNRKGNKGKANGDKNSAGYNGGTGSGTAGRNGSGYESESGNGRGSGAGNYQLSGRKALNKPAPKYTCNEEGIVVVQIKVNNSGQVVEATTGFKGTTNTAACLASQAKIAALSTKFDTNKDAPEKQTGKIIYNFKLSE